MATTKRTRERVEHVAEWLLDAYGMDGDEMSDFKAEARDLIAYMRAKGWDWRPYVQVVHEERSASSKPPKPPHPRAGLPF